MGTKTSIKTGADTYLDFMARKFLALNDPEEPFRYEAELDSENIIEVSLEVAIKIKVNLLEVVEQDIDEAELWDFPVDVEKFLVRGTTQEVGGDLYYRQGFNENIEGLQQRKLDTWLDSLE
jgi:hypothetical protein